MLGFDVGHEITNAMKVGIALTTRRIADGATYHIHLASSAGFTVVDEPLYAALELSCTSGVAPSLVKTSQLGDLGWRVASGGMVIDQPALCAADALVVVLVLGSRGRMLTHASDQLIARGVRHAFDQLIAPGVRQGVRHLTVTKFQFSRRLLAPKTVGWNLVGRRAVGQGMSQPRDVEALLAAVTALIVVGVGAVGEALIAAYVARWALCDQHAVVAAAAVAAAAC